MSVEEVRKNRGLGIRGVVPYPGRSFHPQLSSKKTYHVLLALAFSFTPALALTKNHR